MEVYGQLLALYMKHVRRMLSCRVELEIHRWVDVCVTFMEGVFGVSKFSARGKSSLLCTLWFLVNCYHGSRATSTPSYKSIVFRWSVFHQKPFQPEVSVCLCEWEREWMRFGASCVRRKKKPQPFMERCIHRVLFLFIRHVGTMLCVNIFTYSVAVCVLQAYSSQFVALIMFALLMCSDRISMQPRRREIIQGLKVLPGKHRVSHSVSVCLLDTHIVRGD